MSIKVVFIEPPKDVWFVMGEYLPPPLGVLQIAAYVEREVDGVEVKVLDCNAQQIGWAGMENQLKSYNPDIVASSSLATCNAYAVIRTLETAKRVDSNILTVVGGQHFTTQADESLKDYPVIDVVVRGEGEQTFTELVKNTRKKAPPSAHALLHIKGISFRHDSEIIHSPNRPLIENLDDLPYPGYHLVSDFIDRYHFMAMAGRKAGYALIEGSRGCVHRCTFCSQWTFWQGTFRRKSPKRVVDEMYYCLNNYGCRFIWLTDDNFVLDSWSRDIAQELLDRGISREIMWFVQARCDDAIRNEKYLPILRRSGLRWVLLGVESSSRSTLKSFRKNMTPEEAKMAVELLKRNDIFTQAMIIIGERRECRESISEVRKFVNELDPDFAIFAILTPFPGTAFFEEARKNDWVEDFNWSNYDMIHAIMPTEALSRKELQEELYSCYRSFYGSWNRRVKGLFSRNKLKRRIYWYMVGKGIMNQLKTLFETL